MRIRNIYTMLITMLCRYIAMTLSSIFMVLLISFLILPQTIIAQEELPYDEISVFIEIPKVGGGEIDAVIKGQDLYLPVTDLFDFLKIRNVPDADLESISGFFINPEAVYNISRTENKITYHDKTYALDPGDLIRTESNLYLKIQYFGNVFGLECIFNFRSLSVTVNSQLELPLIREMRQEQMRKNLTRLKGNITADTTIGRGYPKFRFGVADWSLYATEEIDGKSDIRINTALGAMIAGGEASAALTYNSMEKFSEKQQYYLWRYVNNDFSPLRQIRAGKVNAQSIASLFNPVVGVQLTNTPTTYRRSFGSYTLSDKTEPGWIVELYVNNVLVDYLKADASGFFSFQVPLVYGNTNVKLRFFSPWGEERTREQFISIPFNFLPVNTLEYTASAGVVEDSVLSRFSRISANYGISRNISAGGGVEYLSSVTSGPFMPFINTSFRLLNNILLSGEYTYGVRAKGTLSYQLPLNIQLDMNYTWYDKEQTAISYNYREERKVSLSMPLRIKAFASYNRFSYYQIVLPTTDYTTAEWLFSGSFLGVNTNLTTYGNFISNISPYFYSNLSLSARVPGGFTIMPQVQYGYNKNGLITSKIAIEKHLFMHGYLNISFEQNFISDTKYAELGFRYDFSFAQAGASVRQSDKTTSFVQYARGSIINDSKTKYIGTDNRTNLGKGGISVLAFIDINSNGLRDSGEPKVYGLDLRTNGGRIEKSEQDTIIRILGLEPYTNYFIELDQSSIDNISWRLPFKTLNVAVDPNIIKNIEVPVSVIAEATGNVVLDKDGAVIGQGRIRINFMDETGKLYSRTLTEDDGYYSYLGLTQGRYKISVDSIQLNKLQLASVPEYHTITVEGGREGEIFEGLDFTLNPKPADTTVKEQVVMTKPVIRKDTTYMTVHELTQELVTVGEDSYAIQLGAFRKKSNAETLRIKLMKLLDKDVEIISENDFFKVRITGLKDRQEVDETLLLLRLNGITEVWLISLKGKKEWIHTSREDSIASIKETIISQPISVANRNLTVQAGAFKTESNALELKDRLRKTLDKPVEIIEENGYHKVRISGFNSREEMENLLPSLGDLGLKDVWILPVKKEQTPPPVEEHKEEPAAEEKVAVNEIIEEVPQVTIDTIAPLVEVLKDDTPFTPEVISIPKPTVSLQVGVFNKKSDALKAKRRITSKLGLDVEIIEKWDYYIVLVRGFYTRQETYKFYPELAGLGYPGVSLIEE